MGIQVRSGAAWRDVIAPGRLMYVRVGGAWMPVLDMWVRDQGVWQKATGYSAPTLAAPTNLRMNGPDANNHSSIPVTWDWTQPANGLPVGDFHVVLTDEGGLPPGGSILREMYPAGGSRVHTFTNVTPNKRYKIYVAARYAGGGRADSAYAGPLNWFVGQDSYVIQQGDPVYGWGSTQEYIPPYYYSYTSAANGDNNTWGFGKAIDNNFSTYWNTDIVDPTVNGYQGEGWMVQPPGWDCNLVGVRYWCINPHTLWVGVYINNAWQGGLKPYADDGKYTGWRGTYVNANYGGPYASGDIGVGPYDCRGQFVLVRGLEQVASWDGYNWRMEAIEVRLLVQPWVQTGWTPRTIAAIPSGSY